MNGKQISQLQFKAMDDYREYMSKDEDTKDDTDSDNEVGDRIFRVARHFVVTSTNYFRIDFTLLHHLLACTFNTCWR